jgi:hypothetical protein
MCEILIGAAMSFSSCCWLLLLLAEGSSGPAFLSPGERVCRRRIEDRWLIRRVQPWVRGKNLAHLAPSRLDNRREIAIILQHDRLSANSQTWSGDESRCEVWRRNTIKAEDVASCSTAPPQAGARELAL